MRLRRARTHLGRALQCRFAARCRAGLGLQNVRQALGQLEQDAANGGQHGIHNNAEVLLLNQVEHDGEERFGSLAVVGNGGARVRAASAREGGVGAKGRPRRERAASARKGGLGARGRRRLAWRRFAASCSL